MGINRESLPPHVLEMVEREERRQSATRPADIPNTREVRRVNKYHVAPKDDRTWNGKVYDSKAEMFYAKRLGTGVAMGVIVDYIEHPRIRLGEDTVYEADFLVVETDGVYYVDVKGHETPEFKRVKKLWRKYGRLPLRIVKRNGDGFETAQVVVREAA